MAFIELTPVLSGGGPGPKLLVNVDNITTIMQSEGGAVQIYFADGGNDFVSVIEGYQTVQGLIEAALDGRRMP